MPLHWHRLGKCTRCPSALLTRPQVADVLGDCERLLLVAAGDLAPNNDVVLLWPDVLLLLTCIESNPQLGH